MFQQVILRRIGGSISALLPKDMAQRLHLAAGDRILAIETDRGILLTPYDPTIERALNLASRAASKYEKALRKIAGQRGKAQDVIKDSANQTGKT